MNKNETFSEFELHLLAMICKGESSTVIGNTLHKSPRTIEEHREKLYKKLGVRTKVQLIVEAVRRKLI